MTKVCTHCKESKPASEFHRHRGNPDGLHSWCKECRSSRTKEERRAVEGSVAEKRVLAEQGHQRCSECRVVKPLDGFYRKSAAVNGRKSRCIECYNAASDEYRKTPEAKAKRAEAHRRRRDADPESFRAKQREIAFRHKYGITVADYEFMLAAQDGRCAICFALPLPDEPLYVDHCHDSGDVRGLLCRKCNSGLGMFEDDRERLARAAAYLDGVVGPTTWAKAWTAPIS